MLLPKAQIVPKLRKVDFEVRRSIKTADVLAVHSCGL